MKNRDSLVAILLAVIGACAALGAVMLSSAYPSLSHAVYLEIFWSIIGMAIVSFLIAILILVWPEHKTGPSLDLKGVMKTVIGTDELSDNTSEAILDVIEALPQHAALGEITVWGRPQDVLSWAGVKKNLVEISRDYWRDHKINETLFLGKGTSKTMTGHFSDHDSYEDLHFDKKQIKQFKKHYDK